MAANQSRPLSKSEFARTAGVTRNAVQKAAKPGGYLEAAVLDSGRIDLNHKDARWYIEKHGGTIPRQAGAKGAAGAEPAEPKREPTPRSQRGGYAKRKNEIESAPMPDPGGGGDHADVPERIEPFADMTLRQLIGRFGTETAFKDWLSALKAIEDIRDKRIKNAQSEGSLIQRDLVEHHVLGSFEAAHINLMTDGAQTIAARVSAMVQAGADDAEIQRFVSDTMSKMIKAAKQKAERSLRNA